MISEINHFHLFFGLGGGAAGFQEARPEIPGLQGRMVCIGGMDVDPAGAEDFYRFTGVRGVVRDLFDRSQYRDFHGRGPAPGWVEAMPADVRAAAHGKVPNIVFLSAPCKGFSGLLSETRSTTAKYQALNRLTLRGVWLMLEAWADDPPDTILFENVPRIATRGRHLLDQITGMLRHYGYVVRETTHDCGELGGLAQSRKRFLLIARHAEKVPPFIYEPPKRPLRSVGEILSRYGRPGDPALGPMHRVPSLNWKTWVRLAFVEPGKDWRSLNRLAVENGHLRDYLIVPEAHHGSLGVQRWDAASGTVSSRCGPTNGAYSVADPRQQVYSAGYGVNAWDAATGAVAGESLPSNGRFAVADPRAQDGAAQYQQYGVMSMEDTAGAVIGVKSPGQGTFSVADPRGFGADTHKNVYRVVPWEGAVGVIGGGHGPSSGGQAVADPRHAGPAKHSNEFRIVPFDGQARAVTGAHGTGQCVADPLGGRLPAEQHGKYRMTAWDEASRAVISGNANGAYAVADPRPNMERGRGDNYLTAGHYGVVDPAEPSGAVSASACHDNGRWSVADWRLPEATDKLVCVIRALDGTWHRPFTTLDLAALQSLYDPDDYAEAAEQFVLHGNSDQAWRERIGNAVPKKAAKAMAEEIGRAILLSRAGESFQLSSTPIWVRPIATALAVRGGEGA
ncbi:DNA (cytosine-5-)-methyltransferase [Achromobacter xylosoxidans]|uniref:DNA cytosine methyltransferase n=1 Tax=Alcaligenes xylosoxydans xylosoxydans TaxID=85698 RepID=UPI0006C1D9F8|nr:DNA cytosine methyltransferase [Achromobacter xylosoxidans]CUK19192.1 DNA (cytosine-5-)-methyltransferase [Achromobacter xylosoxidans]